jgi:pterin-4a-carbinolamine dehydratase
MPQARATEPLKAESIQSKLKAERIQERLKAERIQEPLKAERIQQRLADIPGWALDEEATALVRTYDLPSLRAAGAFVELVLAVGEATDYAPQIDVRGREVTARVATAPGSGVSDLDFDWVELLHGGR